MSFTKKGRKIRPSVGKTFPAGPNGQAPPPSFAEAMATLLRKAYGGRHSAVKVVAAAIGANERAVRNWFDAKNGPSGEHLILLMSHSDEMLDGFLALAGKRQFAVGMEMKRAKLALENALCELMDEGYCRSVLVANRATAISHHVKAR
jgi:hypothetical protein